MSNPKSNQNNREYWGKFYSNIPQINLNQVQKDSWQWFLDFGIKESLSEINPIEDFTGKNWQLEFIDHSIEKPTITPQLALNKGLTYSSALRITTRLTNRQTGKSLASAARGLRAAPAVGRA